MEVGAQFAKENLALLERLFATFNAIGRGPLCERDASLWHMCQGYVGRFWAYLDGFDGAPTLHCHIPYGPNRPTLGNLAQLRVL